jgi:four helix bundle protein
MKIERFEDIEAWQLARQLTRQVYHLSQKPGFEKDFGLKNQIQSASGSAMHNIAEGFDSESNTEFIRFLRYAKRSCTEVQSELYVALDETYISTEEFQEVYEHARRTRAAIRGFINYLVKFKASQKTAPFKPLPPEPMNHEPLNREPLNREPLNREP